MTQWVEIDVRNLLYDAACRLGEVHDPSGKAVLHLATAAGIDTDAAEGIGSRLSGVAARLAKHGSIEREIRGKRTFTIRAVPDNPPAKGGKLTAWPLYNGAVEKARRARPEPRTCSECGRYLPATRFPTTRDGTSREAECRECRDTRRQNRQEPLDGQPAPEDPPETPSGPPGAADAVSEALDYDRLAAAILSRYARSEERLGQAVEELQRLREVDAQLRTTKRELRETTEQLDATKAERDQLREQLQDADRQLKSLRRQVKEQEQRGHRVADLVDESTRNALGRLVEEAPGR